MTRALAAGLSGPPPLDESAVWVEGPWRHRTVSAAGTRFHVVELGEGPAVLLLHDSAQFWWTWRHQLTGLARAGYRAVAMDLRGHGASDKPPRGYDLPTLAHDAAGVVRALGEERAGVVGHGTGALVAWTMATYAPQGVRCLAALSMPHPLLLGSGLRPFRGGLGGDLLASRVPGIAEHRLRRWLARSGLRRDIRRFRERMRAAVTAPTLQLHGARDSSLPLEQARGSQRYVRASFSVHVVADAGRHPHEERPAVVNDVLVPWLQNC